MYLCCDLGGTTCDVGFFDPTLRKILQRKQYENDRHPDLYHILNDYLSVHADLVATSGLSQVVIAAAGPVDGKRVTITNMEGWGVDLDVVQEVIGDRGIEAAVHLINDFEALGYGILYLQEHGLQAEDYERIHGRFHHDALGVQFRRRTRSLICGPGSGLGVACVVDGLQRDGLPYVFTSEGGHHSLAPETLEQFQLLYPSNQFGGRTKSYEDVLSKRGLTNLYNFFKRKHDPSEPIHQLEANDIIERSKRAGDQAARDAVEMFAEVLSNFCGNAALTFNCDKVVYLWGGVLREMDSSLLSYRFKEFYGARSEHGNRVDTVPVILLRNEMVPLLGCAKRALAEDCR